MKLGSEAELVLWSVAVKDIGKETGEAIAPVWGLSN